ncbi:MAG: AAA family ATPase [Gammaproteobacteria bacterium]|nr:AAA family ATPase [Gammaproteobacteria bacterium]
MAIDALCIANFKAFAASQRVPLRPITLIYGANSAGKSSVLHALALAHHAIETGDLDSQRTQIGGEAIDLGGFRQYVHRRERQRQVEFRFELDPRQLSSRVAELLRSAQSVVVEVAIGEGRMANDAVMPSVSMGEKDQETGVATERFLLEVDGAPLLSMSARASGRLRLDRLDHTHPVFRTLLQGLLLLATTTQEIHEEDFAALTEVLDAIVPEIGAATRGGLFPRIEEEESSAGEGEESWDPLLPVSRGRRHQDLARAVRLFVPKALRDLLEGLGATIENNIRRLRYLGPLRSYPPRHLAFSQHHDPNWFAGGGYAWDVVRNRMDVRQRVNAWLGDAVRLKTPYELEVRDLMPAMALSRELPDMLEEALHDFVASLVGFEGYGPQELSESVTKLVQQVADTERDDQYELVPDIRELIEAAVDSEELCHRWTEVIRERSDVLRDLVLIDKRNGTRVSHRDVGIGISQVLPVLVSAYASENQLLAIEQPEIHLHPALQAELGDVFLESALGEGNNTLLIETHSEHLLLRIMRRIRETSSDTLPDGVPPVTPDDVMVLFVEPDGAASLVREMPLNERGELVKAWPGGFFEEGLREIF